MDKPNVRVFADTEPKYSLGQKIYAEGHFHQGIITGIVHVGRRENRHLDHGWRYNVRFTFGPEKLFFEKFLSLEKPN